MKGTLKDLLAFNKKPTEFKVGDKSFYLKNQTIEEVTQQENLNRTRFINLAREQGFTVNDEFDEEELKTLASKVNDKYGYAILIGSRLCDENNKLLFDVTNTKDLDTILSLDSSIVHIINKAIFENMPKD